MCVCPAQQGLDPASVSFTQWCCALRWVTCQGILSGVRMHPLRSVHLWGVGLDRQRQCRMRVTPHMHSPSPLLGPQTGTGQPWLWVLMPRPSTHAHLPPQSCFMFLFCVVLQMESLWGRRSNSNLLHLHYSFPPFCVAEIGKQGMPNRREVGHGNLARAGIAGMQWLPQLSGAPVCCWCTVARAFMNLIRHTYRRRCVLQLT